MNLPSNCHKHITRVLLLILVQMSISVSYSQPTKKIKGGYELNENQAQELTAEIIKLREEVKSLNSNLNKKEPHLVHDIEVLIQGVERVHSLEEFRNKDQLDLAHKLLGQAGERIKALNDEKSDWLRHQSGFVIKGYQSQLDQSIQPYGVELPSNYVLNHSPEKKFRLEVWLHGRDDSLHEVKFMGQRLSRSSPFNSENAFVLHPYGRYCNAFKFAGEIDVIESVDAIIKDYPIDTNQIVLRGFSMGGGGVWHLAVHYPDKWIFASPGAGFAESFEYLGLRSKPTRPLYERTLWHWYDATDYALNLFNLPLTVYSGEQDKQIQAAHVMEKALQKWNLRLDHVIGAKMGHKYNPQSIKIIDDKLRGIIRNHSNNQPNKISFVTYTLNYPSIYWFQATGLHQHWKETTVKGEILEAEARIDLKTKNVRKFQLEFKSGEWKAAPNKNIQVFVDGQNIELPPPLTDQSWKQHFQYSDGQWSAAQKSTTGNIEKNQFVHGPIDDAFLSKFIVIPPQGSGYSSSHDSLATKEYQNLRDEWRHQLRGEIMIKDAKDVSESDINDSNLILFGDPKNNNFIAKIIEKLPIQWNENSLSINNSKFSPNTHTIKMIYPNPMNPKKYIVINSGFTFQNPISSSNADQTPKLPDFAVIKIEDGSVQEAGFFDEYWKFPKND